MFTVHYIESVLSTALRCFLIGGVQSEAMAIVAFRRLFPQATIVAVDAVDTSSMGS